MTGTEIRYYNDINRIANALEKIATNQIEVEQFNWLKAKMIEYKKKGSFKSEATIHIGFDNAEEYEIFERMFNLYEDEENK